MKEKVLDLAWAADENYVFLAGVSMTSVFENNKDFEKIRVWFLADGISAGSKKLLEECANIYGREIYFFDMKDYLVDIIKSGVRKWGAGYSAYSRIYIERLLQGKNVQRIIYCDCDLIVSGSIRPIIEWELDEKSIGLVMDYNRVEIRDIIGLSPDDKYYNTGFMLMDLSKWRDRRCTERILDHMENVCAVYPFVDQDFINTVLSDEICTLPMGYNVNPRVVEFTYKSLCVAYGMNERNYYTEKEYDHVHKGNIIVYHCSDPAAGRPWDEGNQNIYSDIWNKYFDLSLWRDQYVKKKYDPNLYSRLQHVLKKVMPQFLYARILSFAAHRMMLKLKTQYMEYRIK